MGRFVKEKNREEHSPPSSTDPYTQKPFPGLGAETPPEALSQRFIFPTDAAAQNLVSLRAIAGDFFMRASPSARADFTALAPRLVERIIKRNYSGDRLGINLYEFAHGREATDPRDMLIALYGAFHSKRLLEVGYRSTRLDPHGKPILRPRVYLGGVKEVTEATVLLETAYGLRRFFIKDLAWAAISPANSVNLSGVEIKITGTKEAPFFSVHILQQSEILKDEPREVFFQEQTEEEPKPFTAMVGGLRRVPINSSTVRFLLPYFRKDVYLEAYDLKGTLWYSGLFHLEKGDWNSHREYAVVLWNDRNEKQVQLKNGHLFIGLPDELPENRL